jgi:hypothetical protein
MAVTQDQIDSFHRFASDRIANGGADLSFQEIVALWKLDNPSDEERAEVIAAINQGVKDIESGNHRPADEFMDEMRRKYNIPTDA